MLFRSEAVEGPAPTAAASAAPATATTTRSAASEPPPHTEEPTDEHDISDDDAPAPAAELSGADVIASMLGGTIVED